MDKTENKRKKVIDEYFEDWWKRYGYVQPPPLVKEYKEYDPKERLPKEALLDERGFTTIPPIPVFARAFDDGEVYSPADLETVYRQQVSKALMTGKTVEEMDDDQIDLFYEELYDTGYYVDDDDGYIKEHSPTPAATPKNESGES